MRGIVSPGVEFFAGYRENNYYYVDKTGFLEEFLPSASKGVHLFTRPRRFGKTLMLSMMAEFFDITKDSSELFKGLAVSRNRELCQRWMNQYPVVFLTLKGIRGKSYELACDRLGGLIAFQLNNAYRPLLSSPKVAPGTRKVLSALADSSASLAQLQGSLCTLCGALHDQYEKPVILLIDEYDVPLACAQENGYYADMISFFRDFLSDALKTNPYLELAVLTGCLRITKESIFTGLNNPNCFGVSDSKYSDVFGFTEAEVAAMLETFGMADKMDEVREWYDGYHFGKRDDIYCPWGITKYVCDHITDPDAQPQAYWLNTSSTAIVKDVLAKTDFDLEEDIETLIYGGCVLFSLQEQMNYEDMYSSTDSFWTLMYVTGYLTKASEEQQTRCDLEPEEDEIVCCIPNKEVAKVWKKQVRQWISSTLHTQDYKNFAEAFWKRDVAGVENVLENILLERLSSYDLREYGYHVMLIVLFPRPNRVQSNRESGFGRYDILVRDKTANRAAIIEVKRVDNERQLEAKAREALQQIEEKKYDTELTTERRYTTILHYGMAFCKKRCKVLVQTVNLS